MGILIEHVEVAGDWDRCVPENHSPLIGLMNVGRGG